MQILRLSLAQRVDQISAIPLGWSVVEAAHRQHEILTLRKTHSKLRYFAENASGLLSGQGGVTKEFGWQERGFLLSLANFRR